MAETTVLNHINVPPAQTWNYLKINELSLEVPTVRENGPANCPDPFFDGIETGAGPEAENWVRNSADSREIDRVPEGGQERVVILQDGRVRGRVHDVVVGDNAQAQIVVVATGAGVTGTNLRVSIGENSHADVALFVVVDDGSTYIDNSGYKLDNGAVLNLRHYVLSAGTSALGTCIACDGTGSAATLTCRNLVATGATLDMNYLVRQRGRMSNSHIDVSGVLSEGGTKNLCDTIDLIHGCKGAQGLENETVLLAGEKMVNKSLPTILCNEDDVSGNHGATIGSIAPEQLEYLAARGLTPAEVTELFQRSVIEDAITHARELRVPEAREAALRVAQRVLGTEAVAELRSGE